MHAATVRQRTVGGVCRAHVFGIGEQRMPKALIHAMAHLKWAAALVNGDLGLLDAGIALAIADAARRVADGEFDAQFPLWVGQTGSGTHSHMKVNEVIATLATQALAHSPHKPGPVSAYGQVNLGQSTNDVVRSAIHIAVALQVKALLLPALQGLRQVLAAQAHAQLGLCEAALHQAMPAVHALAIGEAAERTGRCAPPNFGAKVAARLATRLHLPLVQAPDLQAARTGHEPLEALHATLRRLAQVIGQDTPIGFADSLGQPELNVYRPQLALNLLDSMRRIADAMGSLTWHCVNERDQDTAHLTVTRQA